MLRQTNVAIAIVWLNTLFLPMSRSLSETADSCDVVAMIERFGTSSRMLTGPERYSLTRVAEAVHRVMQWHWSDVLRVARSSQQPVLQCYI